MSATGDESLLQTGNYAECVSWETTLSATHHLSHPSPSPTPPLASLRGARYQKRTMTPEPPTPTPRRKRRYLRWLGVLLFACLAYGQWKAYDFRAAVNEAEALGWRVDNYSPIDDIKEDWHSAFRMRTWTKPRRNLLLIGKNGLIGHESLLLRLNPQAIHFHTYQSPLNLSLLKQLTVLRRLMIQKSLEMTDANMDQIAELTDLKALIIMECPSLTRLNPFIGLKKLEKMFVSQSPLIPKADIEAFKAAHPNAEVEIRP